MNLAGRIGLVWVFLLAAAGCGQQGTPTQSSATPRSEVPQDSPSPSSTPSQTEPVNLAPSGNPRVVVETSLGSFVIELDPEHAPLTVQHFLELVDRGFYDGTIFHQVIPGYVILGGGFTPRLVEKPSGVPIRNEADNGLRNLRGTVAMARDPQVIDSACCQFFINLADNPHLDHQGNSPEEYGYCVFGRVVQGMEVVERISQVETGPQEVRRYGGPGVQQAQALREQMDHVPRQPVLIRRIRRLGGGEKPPTPNHSSPADQPNAPEPPGPSSEAISHERASDAPGD